eukprot:CAMPEP_0117531230 /NCGR_PEP_ID=MMETSP0784-20121206/38752_1 /TAXON_ID=39447 /ORGANISM="" /LENGTH=96 /DNA_ID=CAMNT_0005327599 /DNA_START=72 /DNA_END=362 /DNA_ORIENTATION=+
MAEAWAEENTYNLGTDVELCKGKIALLDPNMYSSVSAVVGKLISGAIAVEGNACVVFSKSAEVYFLVYATGKKDEVFNTLGIREEPEEPIQTGMMG